MRRESDSVWLHHSRGTEARTDASPGKLYYALITRARHTHALLDSPHITSCRIAAEHFLGIVAGGAFRPRGGSSVYSLASTNGRRRRSHPGQFPTNRWTLVPQCPHVPRMALRPFLKVTFSAPWISRFSRHFTQ